MSRIHCVYGADKQVAEWVGRKINLHFQGWFSGIAVARDYDIIAGIVFSNFYKDNTGKPQAVELSMAAIDKHWCSRVIITEILSYPFDRLCVERVQLSAARRNRFVRRFNERLGFKFEGIARKAYFTGEDAAVYSMLRREWLGSRFNGKKFVSPIRTRSVGNVSGANIEQSGNRPL